MLVTFPSSQLNPQVPHVAFSIACCPARNGLAGQSFGMLRLIDLIVSPGLSVRLENTFDRYIFSLDISRNTPEQAYIHQETPWLYKENAALVNAHIGTSQVPAWHRNSWFISPPGVVSVSSFPMRSLVRINPIHIPLRLHTMQSRPVLHSLRLSFRRPVYVLLLWLEKTGNSAPVGRFAECILVAPAALL